MFTMYSLSSRGGIILLFVSVVSCQERRIFGGEYAREGELPYQAAVAIRAYGAKQVVCGGALVDRYHVITAGHCLELGPMYVKVGNINVYKGEWYKVISYVTPYINNTFSRDIAILHITPPVELGDNVQPIRLPDQNEPELPVWSSVYMAGWGLVDKSNPSEILKKLRLTVVSEKECEKTWGDNLNDKTLCARGSRPNGTCAGDSGGPLITKSNGTFTLVGILSYGTSDCSLGEPEVYTNVKSYVPWIKRQMGNIAGQYKAIHRKYQLQIAGGTFLQDEKDDKVILFPGYKVLTPKTRKEKGVFEIKPWDPKTRRFLGQEDTQPNLTDQNEVLFDVLKGTSKLLQPKPLSPYPIESKAEQLGDPNQKQGALIQTLEDSLPLSDLIHIQQKEPLQEQPIKPYLAQPWSALQDTRPIRKRFNNLNYWRLRKQMQDKQGAANQEQPFGPRRRLDEPNLEQVREQTQVQLSELLRQQKGLILGQPKIKTSGQPKLEEVQTLRYWKPRLWEQEQPTEPSQGRTKEANPGEPRTQNQWKQVGLNQEQTTGYNREQPREPKQAKSIVSNVILPRLPHQWTIKELNQEQTLETNKGLSTKLNQYVQAQPDPGKGTIKFIEPNLVEPRESMRVLRTELQQTQSMDRNKNPDKNTQTDPDTNTLFTINSKLLPPSKLEEISQPRHHDGEISIKPKNLDSRIYPDGRLLTENEELIQNIKKQNVAPPPESRRGTSSTEDLSAHDWGKNYPRNHSPEKHDPLFYAPWAPNAPSRISSEWADKHPKKKQHSEDSFPADDKKTYHATSTSKIKHFITRIKRQNEEDTFTRGNNQTYSQDYKITSLRENTNREDTEETAPDEYHREEPTERKFDEFYESPVPEDETIYEEYRELIRNQRPKSWRTTPFTQAIYLDERRKQYRERGPVRETKQKKTWTKTPYAYARRHQQNREKLWRPKHRKSKLRRPKFPEQTGGVAGVRAATRQHVSDIQLETIGGLQEQNDHLVNNTDDKNNFEPVEPTYARLTKNDNEPLNVPQTSDLGAPAVLPAAPPEPQSLQYAPPTDNGAQVAQYTLPNSDNYGPVTMQQNDNGQVTKNMEDILYGRATADEPQSGAVFQRMQIVLYGRPPTNETSQPSNHSIQYSLENQSQSIQYRQPNATTAQSYRTYYTAQEYIENQRKRLNTETRPSAYYDRDKLDEFGEMKESPAGASTKQEDNDGVEKSSTKQWVNYEENPSELEQEYTDEIEHGSTKDMEDYEDNPTEMKQEYIDEVEKWSTKDRENYDENSSAIQQEENDEVENWSPKANKAYEEYPTETETKQKYDDEEEKWSTDKMEDFEETLSGDTTE